MRRIAFLVAIIVMAGSCQTTKSPRHSMAAAGPPAAPERDHSAVFREPVTFKPVGHPSGACMSTAEIAAEQTIRLHTSMMVTGLTCHGFYREPALFDRYQDFTQAHEQRLGAAQDTIGAFLSRYRSGDDNRLFDSYEAEIANAESRLVADASAPTYCRLRRDQYFTAVDFTDVDLGGYVDLLVDHHRDNYQVCR